MSELQTHALLFLGAFVVVGALVSRYPWLALIAGLFAGLWADWRWLRPRRLAKAEATRQEQLAREAEEFQSQAERERRAELRVRSFTLGGLLTLTPREFELRVADILAEHGYDDIEHIGRKGDLGIDLFATNPEGERVGIQCKRYAPDKRVRAPEVRLLYGDMTHADVGGVFVTTSGYTADAIAYAEAHGIRLIDGQRLTRLLTATRGCPARRGTSRRRSSV